MLHQFAQDGNARLTARLPEYRETLIRFVAEVLEDPDALFSADLSSVDDPLVLVHGLVSLLAGTAGREPWSLLVNGRVLHSPDEPRLLVSTEREGASALLLQLAGHARRELTASTAGPAVREAAPVIVALLEGGRTPPQAPLSSRQEFLAWAAAEHHEPAGGETLLSDKPGERLAARSFASHTAQELRERFRDATDQQVAELAAEFARRPGVPELIRALRREVLARGMAGGPSPTSDIARSLGPPDDDDMRAAFDRWAEWPWEVRAPGTAGVLRSALPLGLLRDDRFMDRVLAGGPAHEILRAVEQCADLPGVVGSCFLALGRRTLSAGERSRYREVLLATGLLSSLDRYPPAGSEWLETALRLGYDRLPAGEMDAAVEELGSAMAEPPWRTLADLAEGLPARLALGRAALHQGVRWSALHGAFDGVPLTDLLAAAATCHPADLALAEFLLGEIRASADEANKANRENQKAVREALAEHGHLSWVIESLFPDDVEAQVKKYQVLLRAAHGNFLFPDAARAILRDPVPPALAVAVLGHCPSDVLPQAMNAIALEYLRAAGIPPDLLSFP
ncbi:hypothetical protein DPM19_11540 [Actinomadura craniellae]|uniref:Uncharacterized protein n=2 Tax=Actinomadura craniellae TaxID=2231787 RepID=A0A365H8I7_9ACTN|nr:hypothetical protein DPM19_11540 [Actinomadura craniellae]